MTFYLIMVYGCTVVLIQISSDILWTVSNIG